VLGIVGGERRHMTEYTVAGESRGGRGSGGEPAGGGLHL
jgi:hypothetical protein